MNTDSTGRFFNAAAGQGHDWIAARVPHQGRMCLLDSVLQASENGLLCAAGSHRDPGNPLRQQGRLGAACGIEYPGRGWFRDEMVWATSEDDHKYTGAEWDEIEQAVKDGKPVVAGTAGGDFSGKGGAVVSSTVDTNGNGRIDGADRQGNYRLVGESGLSLGKRFDLSVCC